MNNPTIQVDLTTDFRAITKSGSSQHRFAMSNVAIQTDGLSAAEPGRDDAKLYHAQAVATDGRVLAIVDVDAKITSDVVGVHQGDASETLICTAALPPPKPQRRVAVIPAADTFGSTITLNVARLRSLLDALTVKGEDEDTSVTIALHKSASDRKPATLISEAGIGVIMPINRDHETAVEGYAERRDRAIAINQSLTTKYTLQPSSPSRAAGAFPTTYHRKRVSHV